jgi:3-oxoacyl-[acyl-carrier protein] reductase
MRDKVCLVTGGGSGLGAAISARLAADGGRVVVNDLNEGPAKEVASRIGAAGVSVFDVADSAAVNDAVDQLVAEFGRIDVLVNNAGISPLRPEVRERGMANMAASMAGEEPQPLRSTSTLTDAEWDRMIRVHLYGTFHCTRAALRSMEDARSGSIVNIASIAGIDGIGGAPDYSAAKGGIIAFTKAVASEVASLGIRVNAVAPAYIDTPLLSEMNDMMRQYLVFRTPAGRLGRAEEVGAMVRFLAGDESSYCYGDILTITGGFK